MPKHDELTSEPSLPGFAKWLRSKDPDEHYEWPNSGICACGQYAREVLGQEHWGGSPTWNMLNNLAGGPANEDCVSARVPSNWTFGKCLERVERELI